MFCCRRQSRHSPAERRELPDDHAPPLDPRVVARSDGNSSAEQWQKIAITLPQLGLQRLLDSPLAQGMTKACHIKVDICLCLEYITSHSLLIKGHHSGGDPEGGAGAVLTLRRSTVAAADRGEAPGGAARPKEAVSVM